MNNNIENTAVQTKTFTLPENDEFSAEDLADDYAGLQLSFRRVKIPSGGTTQFEVPGDDPENPDYVKYLEGVIIYSHLSNAFWSEGSEYDNNIAPLCFSVDGIVGHGTPGGTCEICEMNMYGTGVDSKGNPSKGKACKNMRHLYILREGECMPILLALPPTSLKPYSEFVNSTFVVYRRPVYASLVQIGLKKVENGSNTYSAATFKKLFDFTGEQLAQIKAYTNNFRKQIKEMLKQRSVSGTLALDETASNVDSDYHFSENGKHFEISGKDIIDGDRDELPY